MAEILERYGRIRSELVYPGADLAGRFGSSVIVFSLWRVCLGVRVAYGLF